MPTFQGSDFALSLPEGSLDLSTYAFALPERAVGFRPTLVVQAERMRQITDLDAYVDEQHAALREGTQNFVLLERAPVGGRKHQTVSSLFEWGPPGDGRMRQRQVYVLVSRPERPVVVFTLTATNLATRFEQTVKLFDAIISGFTP